MNHSSTALVKPALPEILTESSVKSYKEASRAYDAARIAAGIATPKEVQEQNSMIPPVRSHRILNFPELRSH
jgi:hypothetical protein